MRNRKIGLIESTSLKKHFDQCMKKKKGKEETTAPSPPKKKIKKKKKKKNTYLHTV